MTAKDPPADETPSYYILDARGLPDNVALWWGPNSQGYTRDFSEAGLYTKSEALEIGGLGKGRLSDIAVPREVAEAATRVQALVELLARDAGVRQGLDAYRQAQREEEQARNDLSAGGLETFVEVYPFEGDGEYCTTSSDTPPGVELLRDSIVKASKEHTCHKCCSEAIRKGQLHRCRVETCDGKATSYRWCHACSKLIMGYPYGPEEKDYR